MKSSEIRQRFIKFFENKKHEFVSGSPIVPENDPSLLFINAGMNQFKDVFLGDGGREYSRAVNSQICIRVSGKHNDLEDVGKDLTHLTSFEMLGNWSFGDYYKKEAITWAWELFTDVFKIPKNRLVATVYEKDNEALELWKSETDINHNQIVTCDEKDNFWEMGAVGPCGPCSEIHVYLEDSDINFELDQDVLNSGKFIELWNLVFIQFNRKKDGSLENLPAKHVDTGAGLERLVAFLQGTSSNYQTDLMQPIIQKIESLTGQSYSDNETGMPHRVLADHVRTLCFGIADNVMPSNEGRGYVLRRLLRRACRYAKQLGVNAPILYKLVPEVVMILGDHFQHLSSREGYIQKVIKAEEESFLQTLSAGLQLFEQCVNSIKSKNETIIEGKAAFKLYDTYGFPLDLTLLLAEEQNLQVDQKGYQIELKKQQERSRKGSKFDDLAVNEKTKKVSPDMFEGLPLLLAEDLNIAKGGEARIITNKNEKLDMAKHHTATHLLHEVLRKHLGTHVHQAGSLVDTSRLRFDFSHFESISQHDLINIQDEVNHLITQKLSVNISFSTLKKAKEKGVMALFGEKYNADRVRVVDIGGVSVELCAGTHVNNTSLIENIKILSESAIAAGTRRIEAIAGKQNILNHLKKIVESKQIKLSKSLEKISELIKDNDKNWNIKLHHFNEQMNITVDGQSIASIEEKVRIFDTLEVQINQLAKEIKKEQSKQGQVQSQELAKKLLDSAENVKSDLAIISANIPNLDINELRLLADDVSNTNKNVIIILTAIIKEKGQLLIKYGPEIDSNTLAAVDLIKQVTSIVGGGGGGRPQMAQAGGIHVNKLGEATKLAKEIIVKEF